MKQMTRSRILLATLFALPLLLPAQSAQKKTVSAKQPEAAQQQNAQEANLKEYVALLRQDIAKQKVSIVTELMQLSPAEAAKFWPVYNDYDKELNKLKDERIALIRMYAENYGSLSDQKASELALGAIDLEARRVQIKKQYFQKMAQAVSPKLAARFVQIDNQLEKILDLQIASSLPVVE